MKTSYISIVSIALLAASTTAGAQDLSKEIEVDHSVVVEHYDASRVALSPRMLLPALTVTPLRFSETTVNVTVPRDITPLEPTAYADTLTTSPYNGYAAIGYFPLWNLGLSAGYRILDNDRHRLNLWTQFNGKRYTDKETLDQSTGSPYDAIIRRNTFSAGANYHTMIGRRSEIDAGLDYTLSRFNAPALLADPAEGPSLFNQTVNRLNVDGQWVSSIEGLHYTAGFGYSYFGYRNGMVYKPITSYSHPVHENNFRFNGAASLSLSDISAAYLGVDLSVVNNPVDNKLTTYSDGLFHYSVHSGDNAFNHALLSLKPRYRVKNDNFTLTLGALIQFTFNTGKLFHIAPDVKVSWTPSPFFTVWGKAGGGEHQNHLGNLYDINYMTMPVLAYANSHIPISIEGGIVAGPLHGAYAEFFGGYAVANDWLMPVSYQAPGYAPSMFRAIDIKGWHAGIALGYKLRNWVDARVSAETAPQKYDRAWYRWHDRARYVIKADVTSRPIDRLEIGASYELRACRRLSDSSLLSVPGDIHLEYSDIDLGNISSLSVNAAYKIKPNLSVFVIGENLLNRHAKTLSLVPEQGITGLVGVSCQF